MRVISRKRLKEFCADNPKLRAEQALDEWFVTVCHAEWANFAEVRGTCRSADRVDHFTVFNVGTLRIISVINFVGGILYVREVLTHKEYDKGNWKKDEFGKKGWKPQAK